MKTTEQINKEFDEKFKNWILQDSEENYRNFEVIKSFLHQIRQDDLQSIREWVEKQRKKIGGNNYDGNNLRTAEDYYSISAENWIEIIRLEDGIERVLSDLLSHLSIENI